MIAFCSLLPVLSWSCEVQPRDDRPLQVVHEDPTDDQRPDEITATSDQPSTNNPPALCLATTGDSPTVL